MGKVCVNCGGDINMPNKPEEEDEKCIDCGPDEMDMNEEMDEEEMDEEMDDDEM